MKAARVIDRNGYAKLYVPGHRKANKPGYVYEHLVVVEAAIGKEIAPPAEIHHVSGGRADNRGANLVVCQNRKYHRLLHARARAKASCGNANWLPCCRCGQYDDPSNLRRQSRSGWEHPACIAKAKREAYQRRSRG